MSGATADRGGAIARALEAWYGREGRDLPWRRRRADAYAVWLSEAMLQQTRVEAVVPRYEPMLARFPDVAALAAAPEAEVLAAWEGLGYYRRARQLHSAARRVAGEHGGRLPADPEALMRLPGFGPYMTAAVASIAFGHRLPATDANAVRVLARLDALEAAAGSAGLLRQAQQAHAGLVAAAHDPGALNQAVMDLGARVCTRRPRCELCPVRAFCAAFAGGGPAAAAAYPRRGPARTRPAREVAVAVVTAEARVLAAVRPPGLLGGLWGLPAVEAAGGADAGELVARLSAALAAEWGAPAPVARALAPLGLGLEWTFTHRLWRLTVYGARAEPPFEPRRGAWLGSDERAALAFGGPDRAVLARALGDPERPRAAVSRRSASRAQKA